jgi:uncharacterized protein
MPVVERHPLMPAEGTPIHVRKLRPDGSQSYQWDGSVLRCDDSGIVLRAQFNVERVDLGFTTFRRGDQFVEFYYWPDSPAADGSALTRYYNVFQISSPDGTLKGWYCNLGLPAQLDAASRELSYVDLALDVWANPDGTFVVLDEDELDALLEQHPELIAAAQQGRADLVNLAQSGRLPRWPQ